jgi:hypothetical protein
MRLRSGLALLAGLVASCGRTGVYEHRPVAVIVPVELKATLGQQVVLDGASSFDPEGESLAFSWRISSRPTASTAQLLVANRPLAQFWPDQPGEWHVELFLSAGARTSWPASARVFVASSPNRPPIANAGPTQVGTVGASIRLDGTASTDPDGDPLTFQWRVAAQPLGVAVALPGPTQARTSFTAVVPGTYRFELQVSDDKGASAQDVTTVLVTGPGSDAGGHPDAGVDGGVRPDAGIDGGLSHDAGMDAGWPDFLDPGEVFLAGTLSEGACYRDALAHWSTPNVASVGFDCYFNEDSAIIRPTDGRLLYTNTFEDKVREYHCDVCAYSGTYPSSVLSNDTVIATPCPSSTEGVYNFRVSADGVLLHVCSATSGKWRDSSGAVVYDGTTETLLDMGAGGWILTSTRVLNLQTSVTRTISGLPTGTFLAARWNPPDGFFVALDVGLTQQLWRVATTGNARLVGDYPAIQTPITWPQGPKLDKAGAMFAIAQDNSVSFRDVIVRRTVGGSADVVYTEATNPLVKIHISALVTGP